MTRGKRSARVTLLLPAAVLLLVGVVLVVVYVKSQSSNSGNEDADRNVVNQWGAVAVLDTEDEWQAGVLDHPLKRGEFLVFDFGAPASPTWTNAGVSYAVTVYPIDQAGDAGKGHRMAPCAGSRAECPTHKGAVKARFWIERREGVKRNK